MYDLYVPMVEEFDRKLPMRGPRQLVEEGLKPLAGVHRILKRL
jgi:oligoendopeptidase F